jgi:hypothetical protein
MAGVLTAGTKRQELKLHSSGVQSGWANNQYLFHRFCFFIILCSDWPAALVEQDIQRYSRVLLHKLTYVVGLPEGENSRGFKWTTA